MRLFRAMLIGFLALVAVLALGATASHIVFSRR
jgi:hypothetical protein